MPNEIEHIQQALHNIRVIDYLRVKPDFCDWTATVTFYAALHIVEAVFFHNETQSNRRHGHNHETREEILKDTTGYRNMYQHYRPLLSASLIARYLRYSNGKGSSFQQYMSAEDVEQKLVKHRLAQLIKTAARFLSTTSATFLDDTFKKTFS